MQNNFSHFTISKYYNVKIAREKKTNHEMKEIHNSSQNGKFQNKRRYRYYEADDCVQNDKEKRKEKQMISYKVTKRYS